MTRFVILLLVAVLSFGGSASALCRTTEQFNRAPLHKRAYAELPLGSIKAEGWLYEMLDRQRNGMTGNLDELYPLVMGKRNGWLGGDGDVWERGPYWIDGHWHRKMPRVTLAL